MTKEVDWHELLCTRESKFKKKNLFFLTCNFIYFIQIFSVLVRSRENRTLSFSILKHHINIRVFTEKKKKLVIYKI